MNLEEEIESWEDVTDTESEDEGEDVVVSEIKEVSKLGSTSLEASNWVHEKVLPLGEALGFGNESIPNSTKSILLEINKKGVAGGKNSVRRNKGVAAKRYDGMSSQSDEF